MLTPTKMFSCIFYPHTPNKHKKKKLKLASRKELFPMFSSQK